MSLSVRRHCVLAFSGCLSKDESENLELNVKWESTAMHFTVVDYVVGTQ